MRKNSRLIAAAFWAAASFCVTPAHAVLDMTLLGTSAESSIVTVVFSGSAPVDEYRLESEDFFYTNGVGWDMSPNTFDPFPAAICVADLGRMYFTSGDAWIANTSTGFYSLLNRVFLQDSSNSALTGSERFGASSNENFTISFGDQLAWGGSATFDLATVGLVFGDLRLGSSGIEATKGNAPASVPGRLTVALVPEVSSTALLLLGLMSLFGIRRWSSTKR